MPLFDIHAYYGPAQMLSGLDSQAAVQTAMERFGLDAIGLISSRARYSDFIAGNHQLRDILDAERGIFGYCTVNSAYPDESLQEMRLHLAKHAMLGTAIFPHGGTPVLLADTREIINAARRYTKPILIYTHDRDGVRAAREIAQDFDQLRFVLLNMGGEDWHAAVHAARAHPNVYLEISGALDADKLTHIISTISSRKILFGSGVPYADPSLYVGMLDEAGAVSPLDHKRISFQNALSLFNIEAEVE